MRHGEPLTGEHLQRRALACALSRLKDDHLVTLAPRRHRSRDDTNEEIMTDRAHVVAGLVGAALRAPMILEGHIYPWLTVPRERRHPVLHHVPFPTKGVLMHRITNNRRRDRRHADAVLKLHGQVQVVRVDPLARRRPGQHAVKELVIPDGAGERFVVFEDLDRVTQRRAWRCARAATVKPVGHPELRVTHRATRADHGAHHLRFGDESTAKAR
jgi:hypothetical protein